MKRTFSFLSALLLVGCAPTALNLAEHERQHCRNWDIPKSKWVWNYGEATEIGAICRDKTGHILVDACAEKWSDGTCQIWYPR